MEYRRRHLRHDGLVLRRRVSGGDLTMPALVYTAASTTYTAHSAWAIVQLWGGGGTGGGVTGSNSTGGGGAGGQRVQSVVTTTPGTGYTVAIGQTATGSSASTVNGNDSTFASTTVVAKGGTGGTLITAALTSGTEAAGSTTGGNGDTV